MLAALGEEALLRDPELVKVIGSMPMSTLAAFPGFGFNHERAGFAHRTASRKVLIRCLRDAWLIQVPSSRLASSSNRGPRCSGVLGHEGAGSVAAIGPGVTGVRAGGGSSPAGPADTVDAPVGLVAQTPTPFSPVVDGDILPTDPWTGFAAGAGQMLPLMVGHNSDEWRLFLVLDGTGRCGHGRDRPVGRWRIGAHIPIPRLACERHTRSCSTPRWQSPTHANGARSSASRSDPSAKQLPGSTTPTGTQLVAHMSVLKPRRSRPQLRPGSPRADYRWVMDRRLIGALLIVAVITASITVSKSAGLRIAGSATRVVFQDDPQIGECLFLPAGSAGVGSSVNSGTTGASTGIASNGPTISFGQCDGRPIAGEVVALRRVIGADWLRQMQVQGDGDDCRAAGLEYSGLAPHDGRFVLPAQRPDDPVSWQLSIHMESGWLLPSPALQAAGRTPGSMRDCLAVRDSVHGTGCDAYMGGQTAR